MEAILFRRVAFDAVAYCASRTRPGKDVEVERFGEPGFKAFGRDRALCLVGWR